MRSCCVKFLGWGAFRVIGDVDAFRSLCDISLCRSGIVSGTSQCWRVKRLIRRFSHVFERLTICPDCGFGCSCFGFLFVILGCARVYVLVQRWSQRDSQRAWVSSIAVTTLAADCRGAMDLSLCDCVWVQNHVSRVAHKFSRFCCNLGFLYLLRCQFQSSSSSSSDIPFCAGQCNCQQTKALILTSRAH